MSIFTGLQWNLSNLDALGPSRKCPDFRGYNVQKHDVGVAKAVLFIEVSSFQGVLIRGVPLYSIVNSNRKGPVNPSNQDSEDTSINRMPQMPYLCTL